MSIQAEVDRISTAVQNAHLKVIEKGGTSAAPYLVANLAEAIDTIPEATAGEDVTAETETYTELLTDLEAAVDALPDAGSGGGVETCSVTLTFTGGAEGYGSSGNATVYYANTTEAVTEKITADVTTFDALKGSLIVVYLADGYSIFGGLTHENVEYIGEYNGQAVYFYVPDSGTITFGG